MLVAAAALSALVIASEVRGDTENPRLAGGPSAEAIRYTAGLEQRRLYKIVARELVSPGHSSEKAIDRGVESVEHRAECPEVARGARRDHYLI
jgi:hypothetical protein